MLPGGAGGLTVDGGRALRLAAMVVLAVLGLTTLPELFRAPEPPPIPPDVGFRPGETTTETPIYPEAKPVGTSGRNRAREGRRDRKPGEKPAAEGRRGRAKRDGPGKWPGDRGRPGGRPSQAVAAAPSPSIATPAPPPPPVTTSPAVPTDGSEEFAPGLAG